MRYYSLITVLSIIVLSSGYGGHGLIGEEQPNLDKTCKNWKNGDTIPDYLLRDNRKYNPLSVHTPSMYIRQHANLELLWELLLYAKTPESNFNTAVSRLLDLQGLKGLAEKLNKLPGNSPKLTSLKDDFKGSCYKVYHFSIDKDEMTFAEASKVLKIFAQAIEKSGDLQKTYTEWSEKYSYKSSDGGWRTKIGNMGEFYYSTHTRRTLPWPEASHLTEAVKDKIAKLAKGENTIVEEHMSEEDKETKKRHGDIVSTPTDNRTVLYIILEKH